MVICACKKNSVESDLRSKSPFPRQAEGHTKPMISGEMSLLLHEHGGLFWTDLLDWCWVAKESHLGEMWFLDERNSGKRFDLWSVEIQKQTSYSLSMLWPWEIDPKRALNSCELKKISGRQRHNTTSSAFTSHSFWSLCDSPRSCLPASAHVRFIEYALGMLQKPRWDVIKNLMCSLLDPFSWEVFPQIKSF